MFEIPDKQGGVRTRLANEHAPGTSSPRAPDSRGADLASLLRWNTPLAWFEAVAITRELCAVLLATRAVGDGGALTPAGVTVTPTGGVEVSEDTGQGLPPVAEVARVLLALLEDAESLPVQLRLLALEAVSPSPAPLTLREWSSQLGAFERPGRQRAIQDVYERFALLRARGIGLSPGPVTPLKPAATKPRWWRNRRVQRAAVSGLLIVGLGLAAVWLWAVIIPILSGERDRPGATLDAAGSGESAAESAGRIRAAAFRIWGAADAGRIVSGTAVEIPARPIVVVIPAELPLVTTSDVAELPSPADAPVAGGPAPIDPMVYLATDAAVVPPVLVRPRLRSRSSAGVLDEGLPQVELVVSAAGEVESVRLVTQPTDVMSAMILSAIKTWRFRPAEREGRTVRCRLVLRLTNQ
jgi:hypothetical protein